MYTRIQWIALLTVTMVLGHGCSNNDDVVATQGDGFATLQATYVNAVFSDNVGDFGVTVYYEAGAEPYVGPIGLTANDTWSIMKNSYQALFSNHVGRTITVPTTLGQMNALPDIGRATWTSDALINFAQSHPPTAMPPDVAVGVYFVNGTLNGDPNILGVQFRGYPYAFIFKDVVVSSGGDGASQRYVEQAVVVHEVGHAVGLVNNGLPMVTAHDDGSHPKHSTNKDCVMYWSVENKSNILTTLASFILGNQLNLFGAQSLNDGRAYHP